MARPQWVTADMHDDTGALLAGAIGLTVGLWLSIDLLWVAEPHRRTGIGTALVRALEEEASNRACRGACVETTSDAAREFYARMGYLTMLTREEAEPGFVQYTLQKRF